MIDEIRAKVTGAGTEIAEKRAVSNALRAAGHRKKPQVTKGNTPDGRSVRMHLYRDTPAGNFVLITGPDVDGVIVELFPHGGGHAGTVYFPAANGAPALSDLRPNPKTQTQLFAGFPVLHFASGSNQPGEIRGLADIGKAVGASFGRPSPTKSKPGNWKRDCSPACIEELKKAMREGVPVFLDSGAYSEFTSGGKSPITEKMWNERLKIYAELASVGASLANVVAPDKVGDQTESFKRLRKYARQVRNLISEGANVLVPLQSGALTLPQAHREVTRILKTDRWTPALPFQAEAISDEEFGAYLAAVRPNRVHLLGIGPDSKRANNVVFQIKSNSPGTAVQMDSTVIRGRVGRARGVGPYTAAQDAARDELKMERDYTVEDEPSQMFSKAALVRIGKYAGLDSSEIKQLLADPDAYFQSNGDDPFYLRAAPQIEIEMLKARERSETFERKRRAIRSDFREVAERQRFIGNPAPRFQYLDLDTIEKAVPAMEQQGVSEVARSERGFLTAYRKAKGEPAALQDAFDPHSGENWFQRRDNFVARHRAQLDGTGWEGGEPTRRHLALVAWAYSPTPEKLEKWARRQKNPAPGYRSWSWTQEDWRSIKVSGNGRINYDAKCGAKGTQDAKGRPSLCLPLKAIKILMKTDEGRKQLRAQARKKSRAKKGERVPYSDLVAAAVKKATKDSPPDQPRRKRNPDIGAGGTAIVRGGPSAPVKYLEKSGMIRSPVLDFGSGHGEDATWLRSKGYQVREYDPNFDGVSEMPDGKYNTVLCTYVLNVLPKNQEAKIVKQVMARLRPNGDAFFAVRGDVKKAGKTKRGYQRPVKMNAEIIAKPSGSPIFGLSKSSASRRSNPRDDAPAIFEGRVRDYDLRPVSQRAQEILLEWAEIDAAIDRIRPTSRKADVLKRYEQQKGQYQSQQFALQAEYTQLAPMRNFYRDVELAKMRALSETERSKEIGLFERGVARRQRIVESYDKAQEKLTKQDRKQLAVWNQEIDEMLDLIDLLSLTRQTHYPTEDSQLVLFNPGHQDDQKLPIKNPRSIVGKVREDSEGNRYVLWRPVLSDGSRPRIHLSADEPMDAELVDALEAKEQLKVARRIVEKREKEDRKKGILGFWKRGTGRKIAVSKGSPQARVLERASTKVPLFDSEGDEYRATYRVFATDVDGMGPVKASNLPDNFDPTPGYPTVFQARTLQREGEKQKIRKIARNLDPDRLLLHHSDPTFGTPVVWEGDGKTHKVGTQSILTPKGTYYVLGGNGRLMAILMAPTDRFQAYVQRGRSLWPDIWPAGSAPDGKRRVLVRVATKVNGDPLTFQEARKLAGRTQQSPAGEESPIGKSLSLIRSLGLEQVSDLPQFIWDRLITQDNVEQFMAENRGYTEAVLNSMGKARAESYQQDAALMAQLFNNLMVGYLPKRFHLRGFVGEKQERALLSALPIVVAIHQGVESGDVLPKWDLFPLLDGAERFSTLVKGLTNNAAISMVEQAAAQVQFGEGTALETKFKSLFDDLPLLAVMFGLVLKKGERARDPAITISELLVPYAAQALGTGDDDDKLEQGARQTGMMASIEGRYGEPDETVDPAEYLAEQLKVQLPKRVRAQGGPSLFERVANPPQLSLGAGFQLRYEMTDQERQLLRSLEGYSARRWHDPLPEAMRKLFQLRYARVLQTVAGSKTLAGRRVYDIAITARGERALERVRKRDDQKVLAAQQRMFNPSDEVPPIPPPGIYKPGSKMTTRMAWHKKYGDPGDRFDVGDQLDVGHPSGVRLHTDSLTAWLHKRTFLGMNGTASYRNLIEGQEYTFQPDGGTVTGSRKKQGRTTLTIPGFDWDRFGFTGRGAFDRAVAFARSYEWNWRVEPKWVDWNIVGVENQEGSGYAVRPPLLQSKAQDPRHFTLMDKTQPGKIAAITLESFDAPVEAQGRMFNPAHGDEDRDSLDALPAPGEQMGLFGGVEFTSEALSPRGRLVILNMGLGRDSISMLCLLAKNQLMVDGKFLGPEDVDAVVFSDTGAEWRHTTDLIPRVREFSKRNGIRFIWLQKPVPGTETGNQMADWLETMTRYRKEREEGWAQIYENQVVPLYARKDREAEDLRKQRDQEIRELSKTRGLTSEYKKQKVAELRSHWEKVIKDHAAKYKAQVAQWKKDGGFQFKAERAWWAPDGSGRRAKYDTIEKRAAAGVYHLRPEILTDFGWKGTIPLRSDKSCTGNHKVAPIRKVTEDLAIEKFGPWADNSSWGNAVAKGKREPHLNLIGLAADETDRLEKGGDVGCFTARYVTEAYPLAEMGIGKPDEQAILDDCGFGDVRKSGCWMCPFQPIGWWWALSELEPELFARAVAAEAESTRRDPKLFFVGSSGGKRSENKKQEIEQARDRRDAEIEQLRQKRKLALARERKRAKATGMGAPSLDKIRSTFDKLIAAVKEKSKVEQQEIRAKYTAMGALLLPEAVADWRAAHPDADPQSVLDKQYAKCAIKFPKKNPALAEPGCCPSECGRFVELWNQFGIPGTLRRQPLPPDRGARSNPVQPFQQGLFGSVSLPGSGPDSSSPVIAYGKIWDEVWADARAKGNKSARLVTSKAGRKLKAPRKEMDVLTLDAAAQDRLFDFTPDLRFYDLIIVNSSGGKDSLAILDVMDKIASQQGVRDRIRIVHADLGEAEHEGVTSLVRRQAKQIGLPVDVLEPSERGVKKYLYERFRQRAEQMAARGQTGKGFPGFGTRYCTSEFKTSEVSKWFKAYLTEKFGAGNLINKYGRRARVLNVLGMRAQESADRAKVKGLARENQTQTRWIEDRWLPIQGWDEKQVWDAIRASGLEYHPAYEAGFKRLSCRLCPLASKEDVALASLVYPEVTNQLIDIEDATGALFHQEKTSLREIRDWARSQPTVNELAKKARKVLGRASEKTRRAANPDGSACQLCESRAILDAAAPTIRKNVPQIRMFPSLTKEEASADLFPLGAKTTGLQMYEKGVPDTIEKFFVPRRPEKLGTDYGAALELFLFPAFKANLRRIHGLDSKMLDDYGRFRVIEMLPDSLEKLVAAARRRGNRVRFTDVESVKAAEERLFEITGLNWTVTVNKRPGMIRQWEARATISGDQTQDAHMLLDLTRSGKMSHYGVQPIKALYANGSYKYGVLQDLIELAAERGLHLLWDAISAIQPIAIEDVQLTPAGRERRYFQSTEMYRQASAKEQAAKADDRENERRAQVASEMFKAAWSVWEPHFKTEETEYFGERITDGPKDVRQLKKIGIDPNWKLYSDTDGIRISTVSEDPPRLFFSSYRGKRPQQILDVAQALKNAAQLTPSELLESASEGRAYGNLTTRVSFSRFYEPDAYVTPFRN